MKNFFNLVKINFIGMFRGGKRGKKAAKTSGAAFLGYALFLAACIGFCGYYYSRLFGKGLAAEGKLVVLLPYMTALSAIASFMFSFFSTGTVLYGYKDYDMLSSMPIKSSAIVLSKLFYMYLADVAFTLLFTIPAAANYAAFGGVLDGAAILAIIIFAIFASMITLAISVIIGTLASVIGSFFRKKNIIQTIVFALVFVGIFALSFFSGLEGSEGGTSALENGVVTKLYFLTPLAIKGMTDIKYSLIFAGINLVSLFAVTGFVCLTYKKLNIVVTAKRTNKKFRLGNYKGKSTFAALLSRERSKFFSCPMYVINCLMGAIISIVVAIGFVVVIRILAEEVPEVVAASATFTAFAPAIFAFSYVLAPSTSCSISLEGNSFWAIRTMPVRLNSLFNAKMLLCFIIFAISAVVSSLVIGIGLSYEIADILLLLLNGLSVTAFASASGLLVNILLPKMNWDNENQVVKQSASVFVTMIAAFVLTGIYAFSATKILEAGFSVRLFLLITAAFALILAIACYMIIEEKGEKLLLKKIDK